MDEQIGGKDKRNLEKRTLTDRIGRREDKMKTTRERKRT